MVEKLVLYRGNYTSFARPGKRAEKRVLLEKAAEKQQAERKHLQAFVDRFGPRRARPSKRNHASSASKKMQTIELLPDADGAELSLPITRKAARATDHRA